MRIIRKSSFTAAPWKNGGGITYEAIRVPAGGDAFHWRVSLAHIDVSGPFSDFAAYNRKMVLLRGAGITLKFGNGQERVLRQIGDLVEFDGALATHCELLNGPCVDLNLMVAKSARAAVRVERLADELKVPAAPFESTLIFSMVDPLLLTSDAGATEPLEPWDLAVISRGGVRVSRRRSENISAPGAVFFATISD